LRDDPDAPLFTSEQCDAALTAADINQRVEEAIDALIAIPRGASSDALLRVGGELLNTLDDERAMVLMVERACRLTPEDRGALARQHILMLFNEFETRKAEADAAREQQRSAEVALIQALGPCAGLAFEAAE
jgi:hypothetical protein